MRHRLALMNWPRPNASVKCAYQHFLQTFERNVTQICDLESERGRVRKFKEHELHEGIMGCDAILFYEEDAVSSVKFSTFFAFFNCSWML